MHIRAIGNADQVERRNLHKIKSHCDRMQHHYNNVTALRDGLFNASAVMESQASTRLGS